MKVLRPGGPYKCQGNLVLRGRVLESEFPCLSQVYNLPAGPCCPSQGPNFPISKMGVLITAAASPGCRECSVKRPTGASQYLGSKRSVDGRCRYFSRDCPCQHLSSGRPCFFLVQSHHLSSSCMVTACAQHFSCLVSLKLC